MTKTLKDLALARKETILQYMSRTFKLNETWGRFFWLIFLFNHAHVVAVWMEFLKVTSESGKLFVAPTWLETSYLLFTVYYTTSDAIALKLQFKNGAINRPGEILVFMWAFTGSLIWLIQAKWDVRFAVPTCLFRDVVVIVTMYFASSYYKEYIIKKVLNLPYPPTTGEPSSDKKDPVK